LLLDFDFGFDLACAKAEPATDLLALLYLLSFNIFEAVEAIFGLVTFFVDFTNYIHPLYFYYKTLICFIQQK